MMIPRSGSGWVRVPDSAFFATLGRDLTFCSRRTSGKGTAFWFEVCIGARLQPCRKDHQMGAALAAEGPYQAMAFEPALFLAEAPSEVEGD